MLLLRGECVSGVCVPVRYLPVQRALVTIKWIHYDEKFTVLFLQVFHVFALGMIIFYHFHDGYLLGKTKLIVSQEPEGSEWKFDDKLQILWEDGRGKTVSVPKRMVQKVLFLFFYILDSPYWRAVLPSPGRTSPQRRTCRFPESQWSPLSSPACHPSLVGTDRSSPRRRRRSAPGEVTKSGVGTHGRGQLLQDHRS